MPKYFTEIHSKVKPSSIFYGKLQNPNYIKALEMTYKEADFHKKWEIVEPQSSVCILIYHRDKDSFVLVRQFRPAVFYARCKEEKIKQISEKDLEYGYTYELCAGLIDKENKSIEQIACEEVFEECGYRVNALEKIGTFLGNTGTSGALQHIFFAEVGEENFCNTGGGIDDECIEVLYLPYQRSLEFIFDLEIPKTTSLFLAIHWYHYKKRLSKGNE